MSRRYWVEFNSEEGNQFVVTKDDGKVDVFRVSDSGLYYCDVKTATDQGATVLLNTVEENKTTYVYR